MAVIVGVQAQTQQFQAAMNQSAAATAQLTTAINALTAAMPRAAAANRAYANTFQPVDRNVRLLRGQFQNLAFQVQDVAVQFQMGTPALRIFTQQAGQILQVFGPTGAVLGVVATVLGAFAGALYGASSAAESLKKSTDDLDGSLGKNINTLDDAIEQYRQLTEEQQRNEAIRVGRKLLDERDALRELNTQITESTENFRRYSELGTAFGGVQLVDPEVFQPFIEVINLLERSQISAGEFASRWNEIIIGMVSSGAEVPPAIRTMGDELLTITEQADLTDKQVAALTDRLELLVGGLLETARTGAEVSEQFKQLSGIAEDFVKRANQQRFEASQAAGREAKQRQEELAKAQSSLAQQQRMNEALGGGPAVNIISLQKQLELVEQINQENRVATQLLQSNFTAEQARAAGLDQVLAKLEEENELRKDQEQLLKTRVATANETGQIELLLRHRGRETEEYRIQIALLKIKQQHLHRSVEAAESAAAAAEGEVVALERARSAAVKQAAAVEIEDIIAEQQMLLRYAGEETEEYRIQLRVLQLKRRGIENITPEMMEQIRLLEQQQTVLDRQKDSAELMAEAYENALDNIQNLFTDTFEQIYSGGIDSFEDLALSIKDIFIRLAAELTTLMIIEPALNAAALALKGGGAGAPGLGGGGAGGAPGAGGGGFLAGLAQMFGAGAPPGTTGAAGSFGAGFGTPGGQFIPSLGAPGTVAGFGAGTTTPGGQFIPGLGPPAAAGVGPMGMATAGMMGAGAGGAIGSQFGGGGQIGGMIGGGVGAIAGGLIGQALIPIPGVGFAIGSMAGGLLGGAAGGAIGSQFGGGGGQSNDIRNLRGLLGATATGGTGAAAQIVRDIDKGLMDLLNSRQEALVNAALAVAPGVSVKYSKTPSANDLASLARGRIEPAAQALGLDVSRITGAPQQFTAEQMTENLQQAVELMKQIEGFRIGPVQTQFRDLNDQFEELTATAVSLGLPTAELAQEHVRATQALTRRIQLEQIDLAERVGAMGSLDAALQSLNVEMQEAAAQAQASGVSTANVTREHTLQANILVQQDRLRRYEIMQTVGATSDLGAAIGNLNANMQIAINEADRLGISTAKVHREFFLLSHILVQQERIRQHGIMLTVGATSELGAALGDLDAQMRLAWAEAQRLGISTANVARQHAAQANILVQQDRMRRFEIMQMVGATSDLERALGDLDAQMRLAWVEAERFGISTRNVAKQHERAANELVQQDRMRRHASLLTIGLTNDLGRALGDLDAQMRLAWIEAERLGYSTANIAKQHALAANDLIQQDRLRRHASLETVGIWSPLQRALADLDAQMQLARVEAERLGYSTAFVAREQSRLAGEIVRQHQAQVDAMALSIVEPFERLLEPLTSFGRELQFSLGNPLQQIEQAGEHFREIAARAMGGDISAIEQFQAAGQRFIEEAAKFGASPARVEAINEVLAANTQLGERISQAQRDASAGVEGAIRDAQLRNNDKLNEVVEGLRIVAEEVKRLGRR